MKTYQHCAIFTNHLIINEPVIEGLNSFAFNFADRKKCVGRNQVGSRLGRGHQISLQGQDHVQTIGQADLSELQFFHGSFDGQVKGGSFFVEVESGIDWSRFDGFNGGAGLMEAVQIDLQKRPHEGLEDVDGLGLDNLDPGRNIVVFEGDLDFIQSQGLKAHGLTRFRKFGNDDLTGKLLLSQLLAKDSLGRFPGPFLYTK